MERLVARVEGMADSGVASESRKRAREEKEGEPRGARTVQKVELLRLQHENTQLKSERAEFLDKINQLEQLQKKGGVDALLQEENELLRAQLDEHQQFIKRFSSLTDFEPEEREDEQVIYRQGAESAQSYLMSLISQSQARWLRARVPDRVSASSVLEDLEMSHFTTTDFFGTKEEGVNARMNFRFDARIKYPNCAEMVADVFWRTFSDGETQKKLYNTDDKITLRPVVGKMPDDDTRVVQYTRPEPCEQNVVFVVNRKCETLAKSTLSPPQNFVAKSASTKSAFRNEDFGETSAHVVATTSTILFSDKDKTLQGADRVKAFVVKGAVAWNEEDSTRLLVIYSVPDTYKVHNALSFGDILNHKGSLSRKFANLFEGVCSEFSELLESQIQVRPSSKEENVNTSK